MFLSAELGIQFPKSNYDMGLEDSTFSCNVYLDKLNKANQVN